MRFVIYHQNPLRGLNIFQIRWAREQWAQRPIYRGRDGMGSPLESVWARKLQAGLSEIWAQGTQLPAIKGVFGRGLNIEALVTD
jgi:hypothetical protein